MNNLPLQRIPTGHLYDNDSGGLVDDNAGVMWGDNSNSGGCSPEDNGGGDGYMDGHDGGGCVYDSKNGAY